MIRTSCLVLSVLLLSLPVMGNVPRASLAAQTDIGIGAGAERSFDLVGKIEQREASITLYGYLSSVSGADDELLFTDPAAASESTARFMFFGSMAPVGQTEVDGVSALAYDGQINIHFNEIGGGTFDAPESFFGGIAVASADVRYQQIFQRQGDGEGFAMGSGEYTQTTAEPFVYDGQEYRFGQPDLQQRLSTTGVSALSEAGSLLAVITFAGFASAIEPSEATPAAVPATPVDIDATPEPTPATLDIAPADCDAIESWLVDSVDHIERVQTILDEIDASGGLGDLDAETLRAQASELAEIADAQRSLSAPALVADANRLLVTALATYSRGLTLMVTAVTSQNEAAFTQAEAIIQDGADIGDPAVQEVEQLATACGVTA